MTDSEWLFVMIELLQTFFIVMLFRFYNRDRE